MASFWEVAVSEVARPISRVVRRRFSSSCPCAFLVYSRKSSWALLLSFNRARISRNSATNSFFMADMTEDATFSISSCWFMVTTCVK